MGCQRVALVALVRGLAAPEVRIVLGLGELIEAPHGSGEPCLVDPEPLAEFGE